MRQRNINKRKHLCSKCNNIKEESRLKQRYCLVCHNEYMRENRKKHSELSPLQRLKANCRSYLNVYLRRGKIIKQPCEVCNSLDVEAHHNDYSKPLEIKWLCRKHHIELHVKQNYLYMIKCLYMYRIKNRKTRVNSYFPIPFPLFCLTFG